MRQCGSVAAALLAQASGAAAQVEKAVLVTDVNVVDIAAGAVSEGQLILVEGQRDRRRRP